MRVIAGKAKDAKNTIGLATVARSFTRLAGQVPARTARLPRRTARLPRSGPHLAHLAHHKKAGFLDLPPETGNSAPDACNLPRRTIISPWRKPA